MGKGRQFLKQQEKNKQKQQEFRHLHQQGEINQQEEEQQREKEIDQQQQLLRSRKRGHDESMVEMQLQMERLEGELFGMGDIVKRHQEEIEFLKKENTMLRELLSEEKYSNSVALSKLNDLEQYSRRNNIRIFGLKDQDRKETAQTTEKQVIETIRNKLDLTVHPKDIQIAHRTGSFRSESDRPVIVQFVSRKTKSAILQKRRQLKGSRISIAEDLTPNNVRRLSAIKNLQCVSDAWSHAGKLYAKKKDFPNIIKEVPSYVQITEYIFEAQSHMHNNIKHFPDAFQTNNKTTSKSPTSPNKEKKSLDTASSLSSTFINKNNLNDGLSKQTQGQPDSSIGGSCTEASATTEEDVQHPPLASSTPTQRESIQQKLKGKQ